MDDPIDGRQRAGIVLPNVDAFGDNTRFAMSSVDVRPMARAGGDPSALVPCTLYDMGWWRILRCEVCGLTRDYVDDPVIRTMRRHLAELERTVGGPGTLLDVGAGTGVFEIVLAAGAVVGMNARLGVLAVKP